MALHDVTAGCWKSRLVRPLLLCPACLRPPEAPARDRPLPKGRAPGLLDARSPQATITAMLVKTTEVYRDWINSLKDLAGRARVQVRVDRLVHGNPGQH